MNRLDEALHGQAISSSSRYKLLLEELKRIGWKGSSSCPRLLIFTEYRKTQDALAAALAKEFGIKYSSKYEAQPNQVIATINGSCPDTHLMKTVEAFGTGSAPVRMLIATDVASEGINLHHECHNILHYDLPWSIITLIQRNGRIDRFGQTESPVLRYLRVNTQQGLLTGDKEIFERLVGKVEEINRSRRQGESVLKLYDPEAEERYIAEKGILAGNVNVLDQVAAEPTDEANELESLLSKANITSDDDLMSWLLDGDDSDSPPPEVTPADDGKPQRFRHYSDRKFYLEVEYKYCLVRNIFPGNFCQRSLQDLDLSRSVSGGNGGGRSDGRFTRPSILLVPATHALNLLLNAVGAMGQVIGDIDTIVSRIKSPVGQEAGGFFGGLVLEPDQVGGQDVEDLVPGARGLDAHLHDSLGDVG